MIRVFVHLTVSSNYEQDVPRPGDTGSATVSDGWGGDTRYLKKLNPGSTDSDSLINFETGLLQCQ